MVNFWDMIFRKREVSCSKAFLLLVLGLLLALDAGIILGHMSDPWVEENAGCPMPQRFVLWIVALGLSIIGFSVFYWHHPECTPRSDTVVVTYGIVLLLALAWDVFYYIKHDLRMAFLFETAGVIMNVVLMVQLFKTEPIIVLFQLPIFIRVLYLYYHSHQVLRQRKIF